MPSWLALRIVALVVGLLFVADLLPHDRVFSDDILIATVHDVPRLTSGPVLVSWTVPPPFDPSWFLLDGEPIGPTGERLVDAHRVAFTYSRALWWELRGVELVLWENQSFWLVIACLLLLAASFLPSVRRLRLPRHPRAILVALVPALVMLLAQGALATTWQGNFARWSGQHYAVASTLLDHGVYGWTINQMEGYGLQAGTDWEVKDREQPIPTAWTYPAYTLTIAGVLAIDRMLGLDPPQERLTLFWLNIVLIGIGVVLTALATIRLGLDAIAAGLLAAAFVRTGWPAAASFHITSEPLQFALNGAALLAWIWAVRGASLTGAILALAVIAGVGQLVKPVAQPIVAVILAGHLLWTTLSPDRRRAALLFIVVAALPTLAWTARNTITMGAPIPTSTAAAAFVVQGLNTNLHMPTTLGRNEVENDRLTREMIRPRVEQILTDPAARQALWDDKLFWFVPGLPGDSQAVNPRWVTPYASDEARSVWIVGLVVLMAALLVYPTSARPLAVPLVAAILIWWLFLFLTQSLPRYFPPITPLYVTLIALTVVTWTRRSAPSPREGRDDMSPPRARLARPLVR